MTRWAVKGEVIFSRKTYHFWVPWENDVMALLTSSVTTKMGPSPGSTSQSHNTK